MNKVIDKLQFSLILNLFYPRICLCCESRMNTLQMATNYCCNECDALMDYDVDTTTTTEEVLAYWGEQSGINRATWLFRSTETIDSINLIYGLKYQGFTNIGKIYGIKLADKIKKDGMTEYDYITFVPIHKAKARERGYNQSYFIAKSVSEELKIPLASLLIKNKYTQSQTTLTPAERFLNVKDTFNVVKKYNLDNAKILLIDDVFTTGATAFACITALKEAGSQNVDIATLYKA